MMSLLPANDLPKYHPIPQKKDDNHDPKQQKTKVDCCTVIVALIFFVVVPLLILFLIKLTIFEILISLSNDPKFHVDDATLTQFELSPTNNTLYYNLEINMTYGNPNSNIGIHYDKIKANVMYHGQRLMTKHVEGFYVGHKKNNDVNAIFKGERLLVIDNGDEKVLYESESKDGVYEIDLKFWLKMRLTTLSWDTFLFNSKVVCHLKVPLMNSQGSKVPFVKFERTHCVYTAYEL